MKRTKPIEQYDQVIENQELRFDQIELKTHYKNCTFYDEEEMMKFDEVKFERCIFECSKLVKKEFLDVVFQNMDVSNLEFDESLFQRVDFRNCKLIGSSFYKSKLKYVIFQESILRYANFSNTNLEHVSFNSCELVEASLLASEYKELKFDHSQITKLDLRETKIKGLDVSTCEFDSLLVDMRDLNGLKIRFDQAAVIAMMLGVEIV